MKDDNIKFRISKELKEIVKSMAEEDGRSVGNFLEQLIKKEHERRQNKE